jgi:EAL and modified HD-GYP domain-containing signal transduction protein
VTSGTHTTDRYATRPVHVGRQPIYDRDGDVVAYELLFRDTAQAVDAASRGSYATSQVIVAAFTDFGVERLVGNHACFVNVTREFIVGELPLPFDGTRVGLEIMAEVPVDDAVLAGVEALANQGYTIAVDQCGVDRGQAALLPFASYAKIDMLVDDPAAITAAVQRCATYPHVQLIAERLETPESVDTAMSLGFQLFQGHALGRPHALNAATLGPLRLRRIQLLVELNSAEADIHRVAALVQTDPGLALRVLRLVNAAATGSHRTVTSIAEAVTLLGTHQLQQWVTLMVVGDVADGDEAALAAAVAHARLCRAVAERRGLDVEIAFTAGLLCAVSGLLGLATDEFVAELPLGDELTTALVERTGPLAEVLDTVRAYVQGTLVDADVTTDMLDAICWTNTALSAT